MNDNTRPELMKLLGIDDEQVADKVLRYAKLVNDLSYTLSTSKLFHSITELAS